MTEAEWGALVDRLEVEANENPKAYRRRILLLGSLGYFVIAAALAMLASLALVGVWFVATGHPLAIKLVWPLAAIGYVLVRALRVRIEPPSGMPISRTEAPALFQMVDDVVERVRGPRIHHVLLSGDLNAFVSQIPRYFGVFGWTNYMVLGVPYMQALDADEYRAVVAHEVGHLSRTHGRFGTWIYRIQVTWQQLLQALEERRSWVGALFRRFFEWYAPYFSAYSFPLRRRHEYEADESAADAAGARPAATALLHAVLADSYVERTYWPQVFERVRDEAQAPANAYSGLGAALASAAGETEAVARLRAHLDAEPSPHDTHPTVRQRIEHLGFDVDELARQTVTNGHLSRPRAARIYLGGAETRILAALDSEWQQAVSPAWREQHLQAQAARKRLDELEASEAEQLSRDERIEHARLVTALRSEEEGATLFRRLVEEEDDAYLRFLLGQALLSCGDEAGLAELDRAMDLDPQAVPDAARSAWEYLAGLGRLPEAERYRRRAMGVISELEVARAERARIEAKGPFVAPTVTGDEIARLREQLATLAKLKRAYLVRKPMEHLDEEYPLHVLVLEPGGLVHNRQKLVEEAAAAVEFEGWILAPTDAKLKTLRLARIEGARIYER